jgi:PAS domain S-box-containing protein
MNLLDMRTIMIGYIFSSAICAGVMFSLWNQNRQHLPELKFWLADFILQFTALVLMTLRGNIPDFFSMVVSNTLVIGGTLLLFIGLERYTQKSSRQWFNYLYLAAFFFIHTYFLYVQPNMQARTINASLGLLVICVQTVWLLFFRVNPASRKETRAVGIVFCFFSLVSLLRIFIDLAVPPVNDFFKSGLYDSMVVLSYQMLYIGLTFALFLMVNRRLFTALENDIRERKLAEEALKISEEKFFIAFHNIPDAIVISSLSDGTILEANESFFRLSEYTKEESLGRTTIELKLWGSLTQRDEFVAALQKQQRVLNFETEFRRKSGELFKGAISSELIQLQGQTYVLNVIQDITERKQAEVGLQEYSTRLEADVAERTLQLSKAQEQLVRQERLAVLGQLSGSIGHELRNPLGVIMNSVYFLKMMLPEASDSIRQYLDIIDNETRTSSKIITDLLEFARITSVHRQSVAVSELVAQTLERYRVPAGVGVRLEIPAQFPAVYIDTQHIVQVLGNLVTNGCQAMTSTAKQGLDDGKLTISARLEGEMVAIAIQDNGVGISPENMSRIFEPLFTTKTKGVGLGLPVSQKLAEANGGRIEVQSEPGKGATFTVYLPV